MRQSSHPDYTEQLQQLMQQVGISSFKQLMQDSGISERQVNNLRHGQVLQMRLEPLLKLSQALQVPLTKLLTLFSEDASLSQPEDESALRQEYQRLQQQLEEQHEHLIQEFIQSSLQVLESWLVQWPTLAFKAKENPELSATQLLPFVRPIEQLMQQWGVEAIAPVGSELPYDPRYHKLMSGTAEPGKLVKVRYTGYKQGEKLLYRAQVSPVETSNSAVSGDK